MHIAEIVCDHGIIYWTIDGKANTDNSRFYAGSNISIPFIEFGSNTPDKEVDVLDFELNIGHIGDAEPVSDGRIISKYNPSIVLLEAHAIWCGDECNGKTPIFMDETPTMSQAAVIPIKYRSYPTFLPSIAMSDKRLSKICELAKTTGYTHIPFRDVVNIGDEVLPKKCWSICFDDRMQWFFSDLEIRQIFGREKLNPSLAISFNDTSVGDTEFREQQIDISNAGWEIMMHGLFDINVSCLSSTQLYDTSSVGVSPARSFNIQRTCAEKVGINWDNWVYSNGAANPNTIKAFEHLGVKTGIMTFTDIPITRATNMYFLGRRNASDKENFNYIKSLFL